jgi:hypothetical protein
MSRLDFSSGQTDPYFFNKDQTYFLEWIVSVFVGAGLDGKACRAFQEQIKQINLRIIKPRPARRAVYVVLIPSPHFSPL